LAYGIKGLKKKGEWNDSGDMMRRVDSTVNIAIENHPLQTTKRSEKLLNVVLGANKQVEIK